MHPRHITPLLEESLSDTPVVVINGARQSGKSTLVQGLSADKTAPRRYLTLDDAVVLNAAKSDPTGFIQGLQGPVTLDEVQRAPRSLFTHQSGRGPRPSARPLFVDGFGRCDAAARHGRLTGRAHGKC